MFLVEITGYEHLLGIVATNQDKLYDGHTAALPAFKIDK